MIRFFTLTLGLLLLLGCHKEEKQDPDTKPINLPGADKVIAAMAKKEYETAVSGLAEIKGALEPAKAAEYQRLLGRVMSQLTEEKAESEPAKEAYRAVVALESGR